MVNHNISATFHWLLGAPAWLTCLIQEDCSCDSLPSPPSARLLSWKPTFNLGLEMGVLVEDLHLLPPVKLIPPVGHHFPQVVGVEAIVEAAALQRWRCPEPINPLV